MLSGKAFKTGLVFLALLFCTLWILESEGFARVGGSKSFGSRGSRTYSSPAPSYGGSSAMRQPAAPAPGMAAPAARPASSGIWRNLAMGVAGGFLGSMLFSGLAHGMGAGGFGGSGFGLIEILLLGGLLYFLYVYFTRRRQAEAAPAAAYREGSPAPGSEPRAAYVPPVPAADPAGDTAEGLRHIRQMDPAFDEGRFTDQCMDAFFRIQGAWVNRDLTGVKGGLTEEMFRTLQQEADALKRAGQVNQLNNIAVRSVEIVEAWQEGGQDFVTVRFRANLLDYTESEAGELLAGSRTEPVKFVEYWTFARPVGSGAWQLSAIQQDA